MVRQPETRSKALIFGEFYFNENFVCIPSIEPSATTGTIYCDFGIDTAFRAGYTPAQVHALDLHSLLFFWAGKLQFVISESAAIVFLFETHTI